MLVRSLALPLLFTVFASSVGEAQELRAASTFSGGQSRILEPNFVNLDCTSGPRPDVRVAAPPANGTVRLEPIAHIVHRPAGDAHAHCNGRRVDAVAVLYQSKEGFVGTDKTVLQVDYHMGYITEFTMLIDVR